MISYSNIRLVLLLPLLLLAALRGLAQVYPEQYLQQALENNPGLQAQQKAWEAAQQQADISRALPDPTLTAGFFTPPMERFMGNQWFDVGIMQMFPWFGTLGKQKSVAEKMAESQYQQFRDARNSLYLELTRLWLEMFRKQQELHIIERYQQTLAAREDLIYTRYRAGQRPSGLALDIYRLEIQLADLENRSEKIREELVALKEQFNIMAGREIQAPISTPDNLPPVYQRDHEIKPESESFASNPRFMKQMLEAEAAEVRSEVSRLNTRPMLGVGLQYSYFAPGEAAMGQMEGGHMLMPMVSVSLPVFSRKNQATRQQGALLADAAQFRQQDIVNALQTQWAQLQAKISNQQRDHDFYNHQLDITQKTWELILNAYASGDEGFDELLRIQDQLINLEYRMLENLVEQHQALAAMDKLLARNIFE